MKNSSVMRAKVERKKAIEKGWIQKAETPENLLDFVVGGTPTKAEGSGEKPSYQLPFEFFQAFFDSKKTLKKPSKQPSRRS